MPDRKDDDTGFLGRVYRFVNSPRTEWGDFDAGQDSSGLAESRSDLQIMIERKRRNDFVRKQEFELLRRVRREGITAAQIRAHGEESEYAKTVVQGREDAARLGATLRSKIDELEKTMALPPRTSATVREVPVIESGTAGLSSPHTLPVPVEQLHGRHHANRHGAEVTSPRLDLSFDGDARSSRDDPPTAPPSRWLPSMSADASIVAMRPDPVLEEAAFAFASADFTGCESSLRQLIAPGAARERDMGTWLTLLDLYRATGQRQRFDAASADCLRELGVKPASWLSVPHLAAGAAAASVGEIPAIPEKDLLHWLCPAFLDQRAIEGLTQWSRARSKRRHLDWSALQMIDGQAARSLEALMTQWAGTSLALHWSGIDRLLDLLDVAAPPGDAAADRTFWHLRLATLQLLGRRDDFETAAREMQALYGGDMHPWKAARQTVRLGEPAREAGRSDFMVSTQPDPMGRIQAAQIDLAGQLTGDIAGALADCNAALQGAEVIHVDGARLIRVDFVAAGELINWVAEQRARQRVVHFHRLHRLVALFFCAMGLDDHATVEVRPA